jgi:hypothetical protein
VIGAAAYASLMRTALAIVIALGWLTLLALPVRADDAPAAHAALGASQPVYGVTAALRGKRVESVLTDPRAAAGAAQPGTGWLLHAGPPQRDACDRLDATHGLRMMCVGW